MKQIGELGPSVLLVHRLLHYPRVLGDQLFVDYCDETVRWGLMRFDLAAQRVSEQLVPDCEIGYPQDGGAAPIAEGKSSLAIHLGERGEALCVWNKQSRSWRVHNQSPEQSAIVVGSAPGSPWVSHLVESSDRRQLELINVDQPELGRSFPIAAFSGATAVAVNSSLTHFAVAHSGALSCARVDGATEHAWPIDGPTYGLWFAEDDLAIFRATRRALTLHQFGGAVARFELPDFRPASLDLRSRSAFFQSDRALEFVELDLSSGRARNSGQLPPGFIAVDLTARRLAALSWEQQTLKVFELP